MLNKIARIIFILISLYLIKKFDLSNNNLSGIVKDIKSYSAVLLLSISFIFSNYYSVRKLVSLKIRFIYIFACILPNIFPYNFNKDLHILLSYIGFFAVTAIMLFCANNYCLKYREYYLKIYRLFLVLIMILIMKDLYVKTYVEFLL